MLGRSEGDRVGAGGSSSSLCLTPCSIVKGPCQCHEAAKDNLVYLLFPSYVLLPYLVEPVPWLHVDSAYHSLCPG